MTTVRQSICVSLCAGALISFAGCASVMSGRHAKEQFNCNAPNAHVVVKDKRGETVATAETPAVVELKRGDGFLRPAHYTATIEAPGYEPSEVAIQPRVNPWILGNIIFGGIPGAVIDPATGAMWNLTPKEVNPELVARAPGDTIIR
jgi:uncharacterized protein YceK